MTATVVERIGLLVTNTEHGELLDAHLVMEGGLVVAVGTGPAPPGDRRIDAAGRCVLPGFVDSHTHLVFAGDRGDEFAARMAGAPYAAGGIGTTIDATRRATDDELRAGAAARLAEARRAGITTIEVKSGYGATVDEEARLVRLAGELTAETTFLGAHVVPPELAGRPDDYVELVCGPMLDACAGHVRWIDAFCEQGAFDAEASRAVLTAGAARGLTVRLHANQLGPGPGAQLAAELGAASADHLTHLTADDIDALAAAGVVATLLPLAELSTRSPAAPARRLLDAGVTVALATDCNPGTSYTTSMPLIVALGCLHLGLTPDEAVRAVTAGAAAALRLDDAGHLGVGARGDLVILAADNATHLAYRPGMDLVDTVMRSGRVVYSRR